MQRSRSPLTMRFDRRERGRERTFSMSSLSSCEIGNDRNRSNRSNDVRRGSGKDDKHKDKHRSRDSRGNGNKYEHDRKYQGAHQSGNDKDKFSHSSRGKSRNNEPENMYLKFEPNSHVSNIEGPVDPSVCNFRNTSLMSDVSAEQRNPSDDRLERLEKMVEVLVHNRQKPNVSAPMELAESSPILNPKNPHFTTSMWLNMIDEDCLGQNLDDRSTIRYMETKMDGIIKAWYKTLNPYDFTWTELKMLITRTFPDNSDFARTLRMLVDRFKKPDESITQYYFSKMYLLEACKITGINAVSCLIDGLNNGYAQQEAKANNYLTPESLYSHFLCKLTNYDLEIAEKKTSPELVYVDDLTVKEFQRKSKPLDKKKCFTCGKIGHLSEKCRHAPMCYNCRHKGHIAAKCPQRMEDM